MDWVARYVAEVERYLPRAMRKDVGEELQSLLEARLEDDGEAATLAVLKEMGHPLAVACRYRNQREMVSETLFPLYKQALKYLALGFVAVWVFAAILSTSGVVPWWPADAPGRVGHIALVLFLLVTGIFHFLGGYLSRINCFARWEPYSLPPLRPDWANIGLGTAISTLLCVVAWFTFLCLLNNEYSIDAILGRGGNSPYTIFILWLKAHALVIIALYIHHLFKPYWTPLKMSIEAGATIFLGAVPFEVLRIEQIQALSFWGMRSTLWGMVIGCGLAALWRFYRAAQLARG